MGADIADINAYITIALAQKGPRFDLYMTEGYEDIVRNVCAMMALTAKVKNQPPDLTAGEFNRGE